MYHVSLPNFFKTGWNGHRYISETKSSVSPASSRQLNIVPDGIDKLSSVSSVAVELLSHHSIIVLGKDCVLIVRKENPPSFFFKESYFLTYSMIINKEGKALLSTYIIVSKQWISGLVYWTPDVWLNEKYSITGGWEHGIRRIPVVLLRKNLPVRENPQKTGCFRPLAILLFILLFLFVIYKLI